MSGKWSEMFNKVPSLEQVEKAVQSTQASSLFPLPFGLAIPSAAAAAAAAHQMRNLLMAAPVHSTGKFIDCPNRPSHRSVLCSEAGLDIDTGNRWAISGLWLI